MANTNDIQAAKGFTLIEVLVTIIIIGILSAIALPTFINQANKAKESESKTNVGSMNRMQQSLYNETNRFGSELADLGIGIKTETENFTYSIRASFSSAINLAHPKDMLKLRATVGAVQINEPPGREITTLSQLCQSIVPGEANVQAIQFSPLDTEERPTCVNGYEDTQ
jgi:prepilin-type N-terminal cleavage/methylation domain-containing protein